MARHRDHNLTVRVSNTELAYLQKVAADSEISQSDYMRNLLRRDMEKLPEYHMLMAARSSHVAMIATLQLLNHLVKEQDSKMSFFKIIGDHIDTLFGKQPKIPASIEAQGSLDNAVFLSEILNIYERHSSGTSKPPV